MNTILARLAAKNGRKGQTMAEYAVVLALVAVAAIAALTLLGTDIAGVLSSVTDTI